MLRGPISGTLLSTRLDALGSSRRTQFLYNLAIMVSELMQGRIDRLLGRADAAIDARAWDDAGITVRAILAIQPDHEDALGLMKLVDVALSDGSRVTWSP